MDVCVPSGTLRYCPPPPPPPRSRTSLVSIVDDSETGILQHSARPQFHLKCRNVSQHTFRPRRNSLWIRWKSRVIRMGGDHSSFIACPPFVSSKSSPIFFEYQYKPLKAKASFLAFSSSPASQRIKKTCEADELSRVTLWRLPPENGNSLLTTWSQPRH